MHLRYSTRAELDDCGHLPERVLLHSPLQRLSRTGNRLFCAMTHAYVRVNARESVDEATVEHGQSRWGHTSMLIPPP